MSSHLIIFILKLFLIAFTIMTSCC